ncbi:uncharacterized protein B0J16DRAFT_376652 [Fusarium flagelliforme]|uniref:uncharacterized protein n=1 Tax=Fusarium flagelliforme TaxID=2675880 RepID=UPI001E8D9307|nr:uncharacterized protein B0J16DRAFT_376652 [Fusarium flagelliforme]KAH7169751.1 hypothetical protein B0J16DRAFT_376652 [Fusarium flagelliforme]
MASTQNTAAWLPGVGKPLEVRPADIPAPGVGELLIEVKAVAVQPAEYKIQEGLLPFPLKYPTVIGLSFSGIVVKVGSMIWGASSSFGAYATQLAAEAGYTIVGVASARNAELVQSFGAAHFVDRESPGTLQELIALGPFKAVLAAADTAQDQEVVAAMLAAHGGGSFLSTMGLRPGVTLPPGNGEFTKWLWWQYLENALQSEKLKLLPVQVVGGLSQVQAAWNLLKQGKVSGQRLVIVPNLE